jgi:hypothetical protein
MSPASASWFSVGHITVPAGLIVPFDDVSTNVPSGWAHFASAGDRPIKGVSSSAGSNGGSNDLSLNNTDTDPNHTVGATMMTYIGTVYESGSANALYPTASGGHSHESVVLTYVPDKSAQILIKALSEAEELPPKSAVLSTVARPDLTDITPTGDRILVGSSGTTRGNVSGSCSLSMSTEGSHTHHTATGYHDVGVGNGPYYSRTATGQHDHDGSVAISSDDIYRFYCGLYSDATAPFKADHNTIGMWESDSPPTGWAICDGTGGTPDLVDYFIGFDTSKIGTSDGDGTITTGSLETVSRGGHYHHTGTVSNPQRTNAYHTYGNDHTHIIASKNSAFSPEHYTLIFITPV